MKVKNLFSAKCSDLFCHNFSACNFDFPVFKNSVPYLKFLHNAIGFLDMINLLIDFLILLCTQ